MAQNIDLPPVDTKFLDESGNMHPNWRSWFSNLGININSFMTQFGLMAPQINQTQVNTLISPKNGTIFLNTTTNQPQIIVNGAVKTISYT